MTVIFRVICAVAAVLAIVLVASSQRAPAHPLSKPHASGIPALHKICKSLGHCKDPVPRPGPQSDCTPARDGDVETIYDPKLGGYVEWACRCDDGWCRWFRLRIVPDVGLPWDPPSRRHVVDAQRACNSIVCKKVWTGHWYPVQWVLGLQAARSPVEAVFGG